MKRRPAASGTVKDPAQAGVRRPLRRASIAAGVALLIAAGLWLVPAERPAAVQGTPIAAPTPAAAPLASPPPASPVQDLPQDAVATVQAGAAQPQLSADAASADKPALPEPVVLVSKPAGPVLQLGVFGAQDNAERLREELARQGFPARVESRVVLGPFPDRAAAEAAQAALKRAGQGGGIVVPPRTP
jgi:DedD protein